MTIEKIIFDRRCILLKSSTKTEAFHELFDLIKAESIVPDIESLQKEIFYREQIMSTGIGQSIGIPHVRFGEIQDPSVFVGISPEGLQDYESLDNQPVKIIIMILVGADHHKEYLRTLSLIVGRLKSESIRNTLIQAGSGAEITKLFIGEKQ